MIAPVSNVGVLGAVTVMNLASSRRIIEEESRKRKILSLAYESDYDIGIGLLDYPRPKSLWFKLKKALQSMNSESMD